MATVAPQKNGNDLNPESNGFDDESMKRRTSQNMNADTAPLMAGDINQESTVNKNIIS